MILPAIAFPVIDPVAIAIGPFAVRWYALAYIVSLIIGWRGALLIAGRAGSRVTPTQMDGFLLWATLGVVLGGRTGYVLFYNLPHYLEHPLEAFVIWQGGMSFHGGMLGVILGMILYARHIGVPFFVFSDVVACVTPIGLFFGRLANFINGELWGREAPGVAWAMIFPTGGPIARHPSQLYQAFMEGVLLFLLLNIARLRFGAREKPGTISGLFLAGYGLARIVGELFRQPDAQIGYLIGGTTMGQWLSLPMVLLGLFFVWQAQRKAA